MKKISYFLHFLLLCLVISCSNEPLEGEFFTTPDGQEITINDSAECQTAMAAFQQASLDFQNTDPANSAAACATLSDALDTFVQVCGIDTSDASVMGVLALLNQCADMSNNCTSATNAAATAQMAFENATPDNEIDLCNEYSLALQSQIAICGDADGSLQNILDGLSCMSPVCAAAIQATDDAFAIFDMADIADVTAYTQACTDYFSALQEQIIVCGDPDGTLQTTLNELGDCSIPEDDGPVRMSIDSEFKNFNIAETPINGSTFGVIATDIDVNDTFEFTLVLLQTGVNVIQNVVLTIDGITYTPVLSGTSQFENEITQNDGTMIVGTFTGPMENASGDVITITGGIINIEVQ